LDGFIAGPNGEFDWIPMDPDIDFGAMFARYDTLLMGRKTYEASAAYPEEHMGMWKGMRVIVCSHTLAAATHDEVWSRDVATRIRALKAEPGKDIWLFGGGDLFRTLLDAGVVDDIEVAYVPVLVGRHSAACVARHTASSYPSNIGCTKNPHRHGDVCHPLLRT
jgi:dihydrofolate reductase